MAGSGRKGKISIQEPEAQKIMTFSYSVHPSTEQDVYDGYSWYENKQAGLGDRFLESVWERIQDIILYPENYGYSKVPFREAAVDDFPYTIVYRLNKRKRLIFISAIYHTKRNPKHKYRK